MDVVELIDNVKNGNNVAAKKSFDTLMGQKLTAALDAKKIELRDWRIICLHLLNLEKK